MYIVERRGRGEKVTLSLNERSDHYLTQHIAPCLGRIDRLLMELRLAWRDRDLAANSVDVTMPLGKVTVLSEIIAARREELIPLMLGGLVCYGELDALYDAETAINEFTEQRTLARGAEPEQLIGSSALSLCLDKVGVG